MILYNMDTDQLTSIHHLMEPALKSAIRSLHLPLGSIGLDAGCGIGLTTLLLADQVGPTGGVTGLDRSREYLDHAEQLTDKAGFGEQVSFMQGDLNRLPFDDDHFDWAWSANCVGYAPDIDPMGGVGELSRVVKPGGSIILLAWSSETLLPGYPLLEARLQATTSGLAPFRREGLPGSHYQRALEWFRQAGLKHPAGDTFLVDVQGPLNRETRKAMEHLFQMRWRDVQGEITQEDYALYQRLCMPASEESILDIPGYYAFFTLTLFTGYL
jgi:demethylmenaquinone methyltransferase/2-methoxy-6-polyprenyl-1,4-benzoquinol methylase